LVFFGSGAVKFKAVCSLPNAVFFDAISPSAKHMASISFHAYQSNKFADLAYFEPYYLKDFVAGK
jgi:tRNA threonylcarbamoyladenosine biosynthesis protein TsaB